MAQPQARSGDRDRAHRGRDGSPHAEPWRVLRESREDRQAQEGLDDSTRRGLVEQVKSDGLQARADVDAARRLRDQAAEDRVRAQAQLDRLNKLAEQTKADREERERLLASLDDLRFVMEAFGRDGVPALIVETVAVPVIETRANEILAAFGIACRLELRTQRESQAGTLSEALDIVLIWEDGAEQEFQFFSGGERSRIDRALRLGFAELLVRHGSSHLLVVE